MSAFRIRCYRCFRASSSHPERVDLHAEKKSFVDLVGEALGFKKMRVVEAGRSDYQRERTQ